RTLLLADGSPGQRTHSGPRVGRRASERHHHAGHRWDHGAMHDNLLAIDPTHLPDDGPDVRARAALEAGKDPRDVAAAFPASSYVWAVLGHVALDDDPVAAYAFARTGYHRGLDSLRKSGWRGQGPVSLAHEPNHGVILAVLVLR